MAKLKMKEAVRGGEERKQGQHDVAPRFSGAAGGWRRKENAEEKGIAEREWGWDDVVQLLSAGQSSLNAGMREFCPGCSTTN